MYLISCFADEISSDLNEQIAVMEKCGIKHLCLRGVWDTNVLAFTDAQVKEIKKTLDDRGVLVSTLGSPIGKTDLDSDNDVYIDQCKRAVELCEAFNCKTIRMFSFYFNKEDGRDRFDDVVLRIQKMLEIVKPYNIKLLHENEHAIFGEGGANCLKLIEKINDPNFRAIHDPANYVGAGEDAHENLLLLKPYIDEFHIKDHKKETKTTVPAGQGDGRILCALKEMKHKDMFLTLEPHLSQGGQFRGFSGPDLFIEAYNALKNLLDQI